VVHAGPVEGIDRGKAGAAAARAAIITVKDQGALGTPVAEIGRGRRLDGGCLDVRCDNGLSRDGERCEAEQNGRESGNEGKTPGGAVMNYSPGRKTPYETLPSQLCTVADRYPRREG
jgi:hypothetical protein